MEQKSHAQRVAMLEKAEKPFLVFFLWRPTVVVRVSIGFCSRVPFKGRYEVPEWGTLKSHGLEKLPSELDQGLGVSLWGHLGFCRNAWALHGQALEVEK